MHHITASIPKSADRLNFWIAVFKYGYGIAVILISYYGFGIVPSATEAPTTIPGTTVPPST